MSTNKAKGTDVTAGQGEPQDPPMGGSRAECKALKRGRVSAKRKRWAVMRLMRGEDMEIVARELGVTAARLSSWRDAFLAAGEEALKARKDAGVAAEVAQLQQKLGESTMTIELLQEKVRRLENGVPFHKRRRPW